MTWSSESVIDLAHEVLFVASHIEIGKGTWICISWMNATDLVLR